jgi:periplasmic copper chaperone A
MKKPRSPRSVGLFVLLLVLTACSSSVVPGGNPNPEGRVGPLEVSDVHVVRPVGDAYPPGSTATVDFLLRSAAEDGRDALVAASTPAAGRVELLSDGRVVARVLVGPEQTVTRGTQLRLLDVQQRLEPGDRISVTFRFDRAGELTLQAPVR